MFESHSQISPVLILSGRGHHPKVSVSIWKVCKKKPKKKTPKFECLMRESNKTKLAFLPTGKQPSWETKMMKLCVSANQKHIHATCTWDGKIFFFGFVATKPGAFSLNINFSWPKRRVPTPDLHNVEIKRLRFAEMFNGKTYSVVLKYYRDRKSGLGSV